MTVGLKCCTYISDQCTEAAGRLGSDQVVFNAAGSCGVVVVEADRLGVCT